MLLVLPPPYRATVHRLWVRQEDWRQPFGLGRDRGSKAVFLLVLSATFGTMASSSFFGTLQDAWRLWNVSTNPVLNLNDTPHRSGKKYANSQRVPLRKVSQSATPTVYTPEEVALHDKADDCWIVIKDKVYDVTDFLPQHPGGPVLFTQAGRDATDAFTQFHSPSTWKLLHQFCIGEFLNNKPLPELLKDFRDLRSAFLRNQLFKSSKLWYSWKMLSTLAILAASIIIISYSSSVAAIFVSAFLLGLFWQQCGWISHDFLHHQVFEGRWLNTNFGGYLWGNILQGFSVGWWKTKHNIHHAAPNQCDDHYQPVDPDIDTLPLLAWSKDILATVDSKLFRSIIRRQHFLFVPLLFFARFSWLHSSWTHTNIPNMSTQQRIAEKASIAFHYLLFGGVAVCCLPPSLALTWFLTAQLFCGAMLSGVFVISHNGMEVYNDAKDFVSAQVASTRDIQANVFNDWFTGGLNRQIEHHLFPALPRHNLTKASPYVKALCIKHGLVYEDVSLMAGTQRVFDRLAKVAAAA